MRLISGKNRQLRIALLVALVFISAEFAASTHAHLFALDQQTDCEICLVLSAGKLAVAAITFDVSEPFVFLHSDTLFDSLIYSFLVYPHNRDPPLPR